MEKKVEIKYFEKQYSIIRKKIVSDKLIDMANKSLLILNVQKYNNGNLKSDNYI